jgi:putative transcriptional regulator
MSEATSPIRHHLDAATLMSFAAGSMPEALAAVAAAHISLCPSCARAARQMERIGSAMFAQLAPTPIRRTAPVLAMRSDEANVEAGERPQRGALACAIGTDDLDQVRWRRLGPGIWHHRLAATSGDLRLLKVAPGRRMPEHGHAGQELTLMLRGSYQDETGRYLPGDVADLDTEIEHTPIADAETGCICLIASERPARFKGLLSRIVQPLTGL